jgi:hypothetical protein
MWHLPKQDQTLQNYIYDIGRENKEGQNVWRDAREVGRLLEAGNAVNLSTYLQ